MVHVFYNGANLQFTITFHQTIYRCAGRYIIFLEYKNVNCFISAPKRPPSSQQEALKETMMQMHYDNQSLGKEMVSALNTLIALCREEVEMARGVPAHLTVPKK